MNHGGSHVGIKQQIFAPLWCIICFQRIGFFAECRGALSLAEPRGSARMASFSSSESVIVGKTLPAEVSVIPGIDNERRLLL
jgi:hypothetical protein